ncbi:unnamed protein product [Gadus morhua 'NCC']
MNDLLAVNEQAKRNGQKQSATVKMSLLWMYSLRMAGVRGWTCPGPRGQTRPRGEEGPGRRNRKSMAAFRIDVVKLAFVCAVLPGVLPFTGANEK